MVDGQRSVVSKGQGSLEQENAAAGNSEFSWRTCMKIFSIAIVAGAALGGTFEPAGRAKNLEQGGKLREIMERNDRLIQLSAPDCRKPPLLLLHGATDDPTEMMAIAREWR